MRDTFESGAPVTVCSARCSRLATGARKRRWISLPGCTGKRQAQIECARLIGEAQNGGLSLEPAKTTLAEYLDRWLDYVKTTVSPRTHERYGEIIRKTLFLGSWAIKLARPKPEQIAAAYSDALDRGRRDGKGGLSPRSVHHMHRILKQALARGVRWQLLPRNLADAVDPPRVAAKGTGDIRSADYGGGNRGVARNTDVDPNCSWRSLRAAPGRDRGTPLAQRRPGCPHPRHCRKRRTDGGRCPL